jgi:hypothetical protein
MKEFFEMLKSIHPVSQELKRQLFSLLKTITIKKKSFLLLKGQVSKDICAFII